MPELPEVETYRRRAETHLVGRTVERVACDDPLLLRNTSPSGLGRILNGATVDAAERHGKWVFLRTDARQDVVVHFGMTGSFHDHDSEADCCEYDYIRFVLDSGRVLSLHMPRKFGGMWAVRDEAEREEVTNALGEDALGLDGSALRAILGDSRAGLKSGLMDQSKIAGIGNLLSDELCWQVREHPSVRCNELDDAVFDRLAEALSRALDVGLELGHVPTAEGFLLDVRSDDGPCPRCGSALDTATVAGRTAKWCPSCQTEP